MFITFIYWFNFILIKDVFQYINLIMQIKCMFTPNDYYALVQHIQLIGSDMHHKIFFIGLIYK